MNDLFQKQNHEFSPETYRTSKPASEDLNVGVDFGVATPMLLLFHRLITGIVGPEEFLGPLQAVWK